MLHFSNIFQILVIRSKCQRGTHCPGGRKNSRGWSTCLLPTPSTGWLQNTSAKA